MIDIVISLPLIWGGYNGYKKGILEEIIDLIHFMVAFMISFKIVGFLIKAIREYYAFKINIEPQLVFACAIGATAFVMFKIGSRFKTEVDYEFPGQWDNIVGAVFGVIKYAIAISLFFWFISPFGNMSAKLTQSAKIFPVIEKIGYQMIGGKSQQELSNAVRQSM